MSDVYSFGVVLLELLTGRKSVDKTRPNREHKLVDWARPMLNDSRKLSRIMDPRLEGQYSDTGARKAAALAYKCLSHRPKQRPTMRSVVETLELLLESTDVFAESFVFTFPSDGNLTEKNAKDNGKTKEVRKGNGGAGHVYNHRRQVKPSSHHTDGGVNSPLRYCRNVEHRIEEL